MHWIYLILAGILEVGFTTCMKLSENFSNKWTFGFLAFGITSFFLLSKALQGIPLGTAYAVWTGLGAVGTVLIGMFFFNEPAAFWRLFFVFLLISSVIGLKMVSA